MLHHVAQALARPGASGRVLFLSWLTSTGLSSCASAHLCPGSQVAVCSMSRACGFQTGQPQSLDLLPEASNKPTSTTGLLSYLDMVVGVFLTTGPSPLVAAPYPLLFVVP